MADVAIPAGKYVLVLEVGNSKPVGFSPQAVNGSPMSQAISLTGVNGTWYYGSDYPTSFNIKITVK